MSLPRISRRAAGLGLCLPALAPFERAFGQLVSQEFYMQTLESALDTVISDTDAMRQFPLVYSANLFFAHEVAIASIPLDTLTAMVRAFADAGVQRVDVNMGIWPWGANRSDPAVSSAIEKYDRVVDQIRSAGLALVLNPQYSTLYVQFDSFDAWAAAARPVYREIAQRYKPEIFVIAHEPSTMAKRIGEEVSAARWSAFVEQVAAEIDEVSPASRLGAGGLFSEEAEFNAFAEIDALDVMTLDVYSIGLFGNHLSTYERMVARAVARGKSAYIEETWRPTYFDPGAGLSLEESISEGIGEEAFAPLDAKWLTAISQWGATLGLEAVTPFWTQTYFLYVEGDASALDPDYNNAVIDAVARQARTTTFEAARASAGRIGAAHLPVNSASFQSGALAPESIVSIFPFRGNTLAVGTETAPSVPLPTVLAGSSVEVTDSGGARRQAGMIFAGPGQINCVIPPGIATGPATVTVRGGSGDLEGLAVVVPSSPALYSANASGQGVAAGVAIRRTPGGQDITQTVFTLSPGNPSLRVGVPVDFGAPGDRVFLLLFGTGFRQAASIRVMVGGSAAPLIFAGDQQEFAGLDQANIELDRGLRGRGEVSITMIADNRHSNTVTLLV